MKLYYCYDNNEFTLRKTDDDVPAASFWTPGKVLTFPFNSDEVSVEYEDTNADMDEDDEYPMVYEELLHIPRHLIYLIQFKDDNTDPPQIHFQNLFIKWLQVNQPSMIPNSFRKVSNL